MKKLITLLAVLGVATTASADDHMKQNGSFRVQYNNTTNTTDFNDDAGDKVQNISQRLVWGPTFKVSDKLSVHATFVHAATWGFNADQVPGDANGAITNAEKGNDLLVVNEAYANWMIDDSSVLKVGRGSFTMADGRVVAHNSWEQIAKAFDGLLYTRDMEALRVSGFAVRGATDSTGASNTSGNFYGLSFDFKSLPEFLNTANLHYVIVKRDAGTYLINGTGTALTKEDSNRIGLTVGGDSGPVDYNLTYAMYTGEFSGTTDIDASMYDLTVGFSMPDVMNMRIAAQIHSDTGADGGADFTRYTGFHYDTHNNAGLMDIVGYGNLTFNRIGLTMDAKEDLSVGLDYYMFTLTEDTDGSYNTAGTALAAANSEDDLGTEIDLWVQKTYSSNFNMKLRYGQFAGGDHLGTSLDDATQIYLESNMTF